METVCDKIYEFMNRREYAFLKMGGDFNACMIAKSCSAGSGKVL